MRSVVLGLGVSIDGYIARPGGAVDFLFMPKDYGGDHAAFIARIDTAILGRKTWEVAVKMGGTFGSIVPYVMSRSLPAGQRGGITFTSRTPGALVHDLRRRAGKDIWLMGGGELARAFLKADLVDEIYLGIVPVLIGKGIPCFPAGFPQRDFVLVDNRSYAKGLVALRYRRRGRRG
jgi:dihydrofolate reductase